MAKAKHTAHLRGVWVSGPAGRGKTMFCRYFGYYYSKLLGIAEKPHYKSPDSKWFDGYMGQRIVIVDDLEG